MDKRQQKEHTRMKPEAHLGLSSGVGLTIGSMIGAGVFVSAGYMAESLSAIWILLAWIVGGLFAACGAVAYGEISRLIPRSGGEYRYLSALIHPAAGYLAGWASFLFGMCAPLAANALGAAAFVQVLGIDLDHRVIAAALVLLPTAAHAFNHRTSRWFQDSLAVTKILLVLAFAVVGMTLGTNQWPGWTPPQVGEFGLSTFMTSLFFVGFAYSGWNSAIYASSEFRQPKRDVPRSMVIGLALVAALYLAVNWVFVANLLPSEAAVVTENRSVTLGHLIAVNLLGAGGGRIFSIVIVLAFLSAISSMTMIGPRIYAEMAEDGYLPKVFGYRLGRPPVGSVLLQGSLAVGLICIQSLRDVLINASAILILFTALACAGLIRSRFTLALRERHGTPRTVAVVCAAIYALISAWMLYFGFKSQPSLSVWLAVASVLALGSYSLVRQHQPSTPKNPEE